MRSCCYIKQTLNDCRNNKPYAMNEIKINIAIHPLATSNGVLLIIGLI